MIKKKSGIWFVLIILLISGCGYASRNDLNRMALDILLQTLDNDDRWVGIHAAEFLLDFGYKDKVKEYFKQRLENYADTPQYRIGIWRVLAQASGAEAEKREWIEKIITVYRDTTQSDRLHAAESLAKLNVNLKKVASEQSKKDLKSGDSVFQGYVSWGRSVSEAPDSVDMKTLFSLLNSNNESEKRIGAYALGFSSSLGTEEWEDVVRKAKNESPGSVAKIYLLKAAFVTVPDSFKKSSSLEEIKQALRLAGMSKHKDDRYQLCMALAEKGNKEDIPLLSEILEGNNQLTAGLPETENEDDSITIYDHPWNADIRAAAAYSILRIHKRIEKKMAFFDWVIIFLYAMGMIAVGFYYARKNVSKDDYHLGGRKMNPFMVGLSLFATLLSSLSYLAYPGEMIRNGWMFFAGILAFPIIYYVTGWLLIPKFMKLNMTNAYEILELKIGRGVRIMGTFFFLSLRMLWMATIIYSLVTIVFQTIFVIDPKYIQFFCVLLVGITVIYTSFGGMRAVVMTDAIQTIIMFFGLILTITVIGFNLGSFFDIFPSSYPSHWENVDWGFDPGKRMTIANVVLFYSLWFISTAGSDQMAIQRYLSTKNIRAARKSFGINLITNLLSKVFFALAGLALLAYFTRNPYELPEGTVFTNADSLFPRFILIGLPIGITGLIISAILAAGMSSLSSGLISSTTIISGDLVQYYNSRVKNIKNTRLVAFIKQPRNISITIGVVITILCLFVGYVEGNLLAVVNKVVNLFVAPLFVLFFMALFIPFATQTATLIAGLCSVAIAIAVAFFEIFGIQFLWIIPIALFSGAVIGVTLSALERYVFNKED